MTVLDILVIDMVKITKTCEQYRINIPKEIIELTGWDETTELTVFPYIREPDTLITPDTPIFIKKVTQNRH